MILLNGVPSGGVGDFTVAVPVSSSFTAGTRERLSDSSRTDEPENGPGQGKPTLDRPGLASLDA
jgi:hypothetical protein